LKWKLGKNPQAEEKKNDQRKLEVEKLESFKSSQKDQLIWLGHASYLISIGGVTLLTDPVWLDNWALKRLSELPFNPEIIRDIDYILISHDHRDHCDEATLKLLGNLVPTAKILTGLSMRPLLQAWMPKNQIQEAGWFQSYDLKESFRITFVPTRHWSRRGLTDTNQRLWGGYYIESSDRSFYFMGDSGYGPHFKLISETMGSPDIAMMGVGAFKPEWFMNHAHTSPVSASKAFREMGAKHFVPMHFGTFDLSDEPLLEPLDWLKSNSEAVNYSMIEPVIGRNLIV
jgi:L-ascorbate metabolism protein UlaG (beta-lactamase superfamily)